MKKKKGLEEVLDGSSAIIREKTLLLHKDNFTYNKIFFQD